LWCETREQLDAAEIWLIKNRDAVASEGYYNIAPGGEGFQKGHVRSEETRRRHSETRTGKKLSRKHVEAARNGRYANKEPMTFVSPTSEHVTTVNVLDLSTENGLNYVMMCAVGRGVRHFHRGWTSLAATGKFGTVKQKRKSSAAGVAKRAVINSQSYSFVSPTGELHEGRGICKFCVDNCLLYGKMRMVAAGLLRHHRGWKAIDNISGTEFVDGAEATR